jgi:hypothetical protein
MWFKIPIFGADITYRGELQDNGEVSGTVVVQGQDIGSFTGKKKSPFSTSRNFFVHQSIQWNGHADHSTHWLRSLVPLRAHSLSI